MKIFKKQKLFLFALLLAGTAFVLLPDEEKITTEMILQAEKLIGLNFSEAKRDSMISNLVSQRRNYDNIRKIEIDNGIPPAIIFNPIPAGAKFDAKQKPLRFSDYSGTRRPADTEELAYYSVGQLAHLIKTKKITSVELTKLYLERLKKYGPALHSVITLTEETAMRQAEQADREIASGKYRGMLHGIPYGVKDLIATKDYKTTWGATPYKDQMLGEDASIIKKLEKAGAVLTAKLTMGALASGDVWFGGRTRNPWDTSKGSSGSSAGSAASVSAGLLPFAIGTETLGSIVSPSTVCGVTGLRPTYGRVSRKGAMALSWSMDKIGPLCRNAEDLAIVFNAIYGPDGEDQTVYDFPFNYDHKVDFRKMKIGYLKKAFDGKYPFHDNDSLALKKLESLGAKLIPIELPDISNNDLRIILSAEAAAAFDDLTRSGRDSLLVRQIKTAWPNTFRSARFIPAVEYINANRIRYLLIQKMAELMKEVDVYVSPSWAGGNLMLTNLTGHPCVVLPDGFSSDGTPTSITFMGNLFDEGKVIAVAKAFQDATDFHKKHPKLN